MLVTPIVKLLRVTSDFVFLDSDSIKPGKQWRKVLTASILDSDIVVVFWCNHSSESSEVEKEYKTALQADKSVLPVLLDTTPLPNDLAEFQWVDFSEIVLMQHNYKTDGINHYADGGLIITGVTALSFLFKKLILWLWPSFYMYPPFSYLSRRLIDFIFFAFIVGFLAIPGVIISRKIFKNKMNKERVMRAQIESFINESKDMIVEQFVQATKTVLMKKKNNEQHLTKKYD